MGFFTTTALLALLAIVVYAVHSGLRKPPAEAVLTVVFAALLFGPEDAFLKFPLWPPLDKGRLVMFSLLLVALWRFRPAIWRAGWFTGYGWLIFMGFLGALATALSNPDALHYGTLQTRNLPGLTLKDGLNDAILWLLQASVPFSLGRWFFRQPAHLERTLRYLPAAGLVQSVMIWIEVRFSPQIHTWVYGFSPADDRFLQTMRWGGWRPMNLTQHGLALAMFMLITLLSVVLLVRTQPEERLVRWRPRHVMYYLSLVLVACKSLGAMVYALVALPLVRWGSSKWIVRVALALSLCVATYPLLRAADWVPVDAILEQARQVGEERADSLEFRFVNESALLAKARERLWFGWGTFGRNSIYDSEMGKTLSVTDGAWIIALGCWGLLGFVFQFGLLVVPVVQLARHYRLCRDPRLRLMLCGFGLITALQAFDLLPNGLFMPYPFLLAGALAGLVQELRRPGSAWHVVKDPPLSAHPHPHPLPAEGS